MSKIQCPHCNRPTISFWRKQFLGPARRISCPECAAKISVSWKSFWPIVIALTLPGILQLFIGEEIRRSVGHPLSLALVVLYFLFIMAIIIPYHHFFVPLEVRARPMNERVAELVGSESDGN